MHHNIHYGANGLYVLILSLFFGSYKPYIFENFVFLIIFYSISGYWSSSIISIGASGMAWVVGFDTGARNRGPRFHKYPVICIRK